MFILTLLVPRSDPNLEGMPGVSILEYLVDSAKTLSLTVCSEKTVYGFLAGSPSIWCAHLKAACPVEEVVCRGPSLGTEHEAARSLRSV